MNIETISYPRTREPKVDQNQIEEIISVVEDRHESIASSKENGNPPSKEVQKELSEDFENIGFEVEEDDIIKQHIYTRDNGRTVHSQMDVYDPESGIRVEIEGSRALVGGNNVYRDLFYADLMENLELLCLIVPNYCSSQDEESFRHIKYRLNAKYEQTNPDYDILLIGY